MTEFKGTKGKWYISDDIDENMYIEDESGNKIATVSDGNFDLDIIHMDIVRYNTQLIAAAPELLALHQRFLDMFSEYDMRPEDELHEYASEVMEIVNKSLGKEEQP